MSFSKLRPGAIALLLAALLASAQEPVHPLAESDIVQLLQAGVTPARATTLVEERGIAFDITPDVEERLRKAGADDALLAAVTRAATPPEEAIRRLTLADLRAQDGDRTAALNELSEAARLAPHWSEFHYKSGLVYENLRLYKQAISSWRRYLDLRPDTPRKAEMVAKLAEWEYRLEKQVKAEALVEQAEEQYRKRELRAALDLIRRAAEADPGNSDAQTRLAELLVSLRPAGAESLDEGLSHARLAVGLAPQSGEAHRQLARALREKGELAEAEREARTAVRLAPEASNGHATLAVVLARLGRGSEALAEARECTRIDPEDQGIVIDVAQEFGNRNDWSRAYSLLRDYLAAHPDKVDARVRLGVMLATNDDVESAEREFREALRRDPRSPHANYELGRLLWVKKKDPAAAVAPAREAARLDPDSAWTHWLLGSALSDAGQLDEARRELEEAIRLAPNTAVAHWNLGVVYERQGDHRTALREYREAARLEPDNEFYKENLSKAEQRQQ